ncbi:hypothetical protein CWE12_04820 [Aliidiomarina sedimenti]|uniref:Penicillin-binding protein activator n=1 Tax=Aliidiomarina sedimenti TaxID=1933879 RepID=A0ABY0BZT9_9GAMM|nr:hypothetical protein CWE12_04820 [Aliidiomarina sedimenti]
MCPRRWAFIVWTCELPRAFIVPKKLLACIAIFALAGCAGQPSAPVTDRSAIEDEPLADTTTLIDASPEDFLERAAFAENRAQTYQFLLQASEAFFARGEWQQGASVLSQMEDVALPGRLRTEYLMQRAALLLYFEQWQTAQQILDDIERTSSREQRVALLRLYYQSYAGQQRHLSAARQLVELSTYDEQDHNPRIWHHLSQVPAGYWRNAARESSERMRGWTSLFTRLTQALDYREPVAPTLERWLQQFSGHPARQQVEEVLADQPWLHEQPRRIAVLLPLSGQFGQQGLAVRDGVLAALSNERNEDVLFIDTTAYNADEVLERLQRENIEAVIGPLSRDYVNRFAATLNAQDEPMPWIQLWLNRTPDDYEPGLDNFFALDIDTEVESAVDYLSQRDHENVLVLGADTQRGRQLASQFESQWVAKHGATSVHVGRYSSSNDMPDRVAESLHVRDSNNRIELVERAAGTTTIESEPRSRRDVSAIYLLGDAAQARLLKPFIETNISPFARRLPVFASSSVHESSDSRGSSDLDGIVFSEAPWLLPEHSERALFERFQQLRPNQSPSSQRLIGMGYDAMELLPRLSVMNWLPGYDHPGLTGQLRISEHAISRQLHWAVFDNGRIVEQRGNEQSFSGDTL